MTEPSPHTLADEFAAALNWWRDAGVDHDYSDDVTDWLAAPEAQSPVEQQPPAQKRKTAPAPPPPPKKIGGDCSNWPRDLSAFQEWFATDNSVDDGGAFPAVRPTGAPGAELMVLVPEPEENDRDALLSGPQGRLLKGILQAAGIPADQVYIAAVLRRHTPMPDWADLRGAGLGDVVHHHILLAAPKRLLTFGRSIPSLLGNDTAQGSVILQNINHDGRSIAAMGASSLSELLRSASRRQRFWQRWLEWTDS